MFAPFVPLSGLYVFAYQRNESDMRKSQVDYFVRSKGILATRVLKIVFTSYNNLGYLLNLIVGGNLVVTEFYLMVHGAMANATMNIYGVGKTVNEILTEHHDFFYPNNVQAFEFHWIYCGSVHNPIYVGDAIFARMFGTTFNRKGSIIFSSNNQRCAITINIPDNGGYIHSGLNPEVLHRGYVQQIVINTITGLFPGAVIEGYYY